MTRANQPTPVPAGRIRRLNFPVRVDYQRITDEMYPLRDDSEDRPYPILFIAGVLLVSALIVAAFMLYVLPLLARLNGFGPLAA